VVSYESLPFSDIAPANLALDHATPLKTTAVDDRVQEFNDYITALESDQTDIRVGIAVQQQSHAFRIDVSFESRARTPFQCFPFPWH
jgi:hypothetical protein